QRLVVFFITGLEGHNDVLLTGSLLPLFTNMTLALLGEKSVRAKGLLFLSVMVIKFIFLMDSKRH
ncbi:hypothetical protein LL266_19145, partial [Vibrio anguillarum]|uniref:hypothetical protein n=1 Tax=Vibrio anguillarum TaxID=55601 RepID=UPI001D19031E